MSDRLVNRDGYNVVIAPVTKVEMYPEGGCAITQGEPGWGTFGLGAEELDGFVPVAGDVVVVYTKNFSMVMGVIINGRVLRYKTPEQAEAERKQMLDGFRLEKLERYVKHGAELKRRAEALPLPLRKRMARFAAEGGEEFWIDSAGYEMAALDGAAALLRKVLELDYITDVDNPLDDGGADIDGAIKWINDWWETPYSEQMETVADFGEGHSGNTAGAAKGLAVRILEGGEV